MTQLLLQNRPSASDDSDGFQPLVDDGFDPAGPGVQDELRRSDAESRDETPDNDILRHNAEEDVDNGESPGSAAAQPAADPSSLSRTGWKPRCFLEIPRTNISPRLYLW